MIGQHVKLDVARLSFAAGVLRDAIKNVAHTLSLKNAPNEKYITFVVSQLCDVEAYLTLSLEYHTPTRLAKMAANGPRHYFWMKETHGIQAK